MSLHPARHRKITELSMKHTGTTMKSIIAAVGILIQDGKLLLLRRSPDDRAFPNKWGLPGGKVDPGETVREACIREFYEETGITVRIVSPVSYVEADHRVHPVRVQVSSFQVEAVGEVGEVLLSPGEHQESSWVPLEDVLGMDLAGRSAELLGNTLSV